MQRELIKAKLHLDFTMYLYRKQALAGRLLLHEHPKHATSWDEDTVNNIM